MIKEEIIEEQENRRANELDKLLISKAMEEFESEQLNLNFKKLSLSIPKPIHLSYQSFIVKVPVIYEKTKKTKRKAKKYNLYLGVQSDPKVIVLTPEFEDYIKCISFIKDRFTLENYIHKISVKKGFKVILQSDKGVTKRDFKWYLSSGNINSTNCPFELMYRKLVIDEYESETRYYLAYFRVIHNHPLEVDISSEHSINDKDPLFIHDDLDIFKPAELRLYFKMLSKVFSREILNAPKTIFQKKREIKLKSKEDSKEYEQLKDLKLVEEIDSKIKDEVNILKQIYKDSLDEYLETEMNLLHINDLKTNLISPQISDYSVYEFDSSIRWISLPINDFEEVNKKIAKDKINQNLTKDNSKSSVSEIEINTTKYKISVNKFLNKIDEDLSEDYCLF